MTEEEENYEAVMLSFKRSQLITSQQSTNVQITPHLQTKKKINKNLVFGGSPERESPQR